MTKIDILADDILKQIDEEGVFSGSDNHKYTRGTLPTKGQILCGAIIHLYPYKDTAYLDANNNIQLDGNVDSLMCKAVIFDTSSMQYSILDNVDTLDVMLPAETRIFKDGSTLVKIGSPCTIDVGKAIIVYPTTLGVNTVI